MRLAAGAWAQVHAPAGAHAARVQGRRESPCWRRVEVRAHAPGGARARVDAEIENKNSCVHFKGVVRNQRYPFLAFCRGGASRARKLQLCPRCALPRSIVCARQAAQLVCVPHGSSCDIFFVAAEAGGCTSSLDVPGARGSRDSVLEAGNERFVGIRRQAHLLETYCGTNLCRKSHLTPLRGPFWLHNSGSQFDPTLWVLRCTLRSSEAPGSAARATTVSLRE